MAHFTCNFISYVLNRAVDVDVIIPGVTSTEAGEPGVTHKPRWKYPVLYLLHGYCNDYSTWERYTSIDRYAEERRIAVVTFSAENNMYMKLQDVKKENPIEGLMEPDYEKFLMEELPDFVTSCSRFRKSRQIRISQDFRWAASELCQMDSAIRTVSVQSARFHR